MKSKLFLAITIVAMGLTVLACGGSTGPVTAPMPENYGQGPSDGPDVRALAYSAYAPGSSVPDKYGNAAHIAGKNINIGTVSVVNDDLEITITMDTNDLWVISETQFHVANSPEEFPMTKSGNPKVGHFEMKDSHDPLVQFFSVSYGLGDLVPGDEVFIAAHADVFLMEDGEVIQEEGAWAAGIEFPGKNWATYFSYIIE